jgi:hypothetical protein
MPGKSPLASTERKEKLMNTPRINRKVLVFCFAVLALTILVPSLGRTSQASVGASAVGVTQNEALDFTLANATGYSIKKVYIGPSNNPDWTDDMEVLHGRTFKTGTELDIEFNPKARAAKWDLRVEWAAPYESDPAVNWYGLDLTKIEKITLHYNKDTDKTWIEKK